MISAPEALRERLRRLSTARLISTCVGLRPGACDSLQSATRTAPRCLATRIKGLEGEIGALDTELDELVRGNRGRAAGAVRGGHPGDRHPADLGRRQFRAAGQRGRRGPDVGSQPDSRLLRQDPAPSPKPWQRPPGQRHPAPHRNRPYALSTKLYVERRTKEGKSKKAIIRCLKRYVVREFHLSFTCCGRNCSRQRAVPWRLRGSKRWARGTWPTLTLSPHTAITQQKRARGSKERVVYIGAGCGWRFVSCTVNQADLSRQPQCAKVQGKIVLARMQGCRLYFGLLSY